MFLLADEASEDINELIGFVLGLAIQEEGQELHASLFMSNHHHTNVTDVLGTLPKFKVRLHSFIARAVNGKRGRFDRFWSGDTCCDLLQLDDQKVLDNIVYTYTNPVKAGLVKWTRLWPGFSTYGWKFNEVRRFKRPGWFFDSNNPNVPEYVDIKLTRPDIFPELSDEELHALIMKKVREREIEIQGEMRAQGRRFMGLKKLKRQRWHRAPVSYEKRFTITPKVAASNKWARIAGLLRYADWERRYAAAYEEQRNGGTPVFPYGTYWMRRFSGVRVANAPP